MAEYIEREAITTLFARACGECKEACEEFDGFYADCNQCLLHGVLKEFAAIPAADVRPRWIPVTERLPEGSGHYLVFIACKCDGEIMSEWTQVAWFCKKFYWEHLHGEAFEETITHWIPLPQPPKEE